RIRRPSSALLTPPARGRGVLIKQGARKGWPKAPPASGDPPSLGPRRHRFPPAAGYRQPAVAAEVLLADLRPRRVLAALVLPRVDGPDHPFHQPPVQAPPHQLPPPPLPFPLPPPPP